MRDFGTGANSLGTAIKDSGQVTGGGLADDHAFLYSGGVVTDFGTLGGTYSLGNGINSSGEVTGASSTPGDASVFAFLYSGRSDDEPRHTPRLYRQLRERHQRRRGSGGGCILVRGHGRGVSLYQRLR